MPEVPAVPPPEDAGQEKPSRQALLDELEVLRAENVYLKS